MQWRSPVFRTFCFQRSATAASFTSVCVSRQTALLGTSGLMISFRASGIVPQLSAVRTPICPFENCIQSWTERLAPFGQSVLHLRWNFGVCGAMHNASTLHASIPTSVTTLNSARFRRATRAWLKQTARCCGPARPESPMEVRALQVSASQIILQRKRNRQLSIIRVQARCNFVTLRPNPVLTAAELQNRECILFFQMRRENLVVDLNA